MWGLQNVMKNKGNCPYVTPGTPSYLECRFGYFLNDQ